MSVDDTRRTQNLTARLRAYEADQTLIVNEPLSDATLVLDRPLLDAETAPQPRDPEGPATVEFHWSDPKAAQLGFSCATMLLPTPSVPGAGFEPRLDDEASSPLELGEGTATELLSSPFEATPAEPAPRAIVPRRLRLAAVAAGAVLALGLGVAFGLSQLPRVYALAAEQAVEEAAPALIDQGGQPGTGQSLDAVEDLFKLVGSGETAGRRDPPASADQLDGNLSKLAALPELALAPDERTTGQTSDLAGRLGVESLEQPLAEYSEFAAPLKEVVKEIKAELPEPAREALAELHGVKEKLVEELLPGGVGALLGSDDDGDNKIADGPEGGARGAVARQLTGRAIETTQVVAPALSAARQGGSDDDGRPARDGQSVIGGALGGQSPIQNFGRR